MITSRTTTRRNNQDTVPPALHLLDNQEPPLPQQVVPTHMLLMAATRIICRCGTPPWLLNKEGNLKVSNDKSTLRPVIRPRNARRHVQTRRHDTSSSDDCGCLCLTPRLFRMTCHRLQYRWLKPSLFNSPATWNLHMHILTTLVSLLAVIMLRNISQPCRTLMLL
jgi:hypothetical protein